MGFLRVGSVACCNCPHICLGFWSNFKLYALKHPKFTCTVSPVRDYSIILLRKEVMTLGHVIVTCFALFLHFRPFGHQHLPLRAKHGYKDTSIIRKPLATVVINFMTTNLVCSV